MEFHHLLRIVDDEPLFETGILLAGNVDPFDGHRPEDCAFENTAPAPDGDCISGQVAYFSDCREAGA